MLLLIQQPSLLTTTIILIGITPVMNRSTIPVGLLLKRPSQSMTLVLQVGVFRMEAATVSGQKLLVLHHSLTNHYTAVLIMAWTSPESLVMPPSGILPQVLSMTTMAVCSVSAVTVAIGLHRLASPMRTS